MLLHPKSSSILSRFGSRLLRVAGRAIVVGLAGWIGVGSLAALSSPAALSSLEAQGGQRVTFWTIRDAMSVDIQQERSILQPANGGNQTPTWIHLRESLVIGEDDANGLPRFRLDFDGEVGSTGAPNAEFQEAYRRYGRYLHLYASFRINDPAAAQRNYRLQYLDSRIRIGRPTQRIALLPRRLGRTAWILEIDDATGYPLYRAEYDHAGRLVSKIEVTSFQLRSAINLDEEWSEPSVPIDFFPTTQAARSQLPASARILIPTANELPATFVFERAWIVRNDLNPEVSLVFAYTDGLDEIFVMQTLNGLSLPLPVPLSSSPDDRSYAIYGYHDFSVSQFAFHWNSVRVAVVGRPGQPRLPALAETLLTRAVRR